MNSNKIISNNNNNHSLSEINITYYCFYYVHTMINKISEKVLIV